MDAAYGSWSLDMGDLLVWLLLLKWSGLLMELLLLIGGQAAHTAAASQIGAGAHAVAIPWMRLGCVELLLLSHGCAAPVAAAPQMKACHVKLLLFSLRRASHMSAAHVVTVGQSEGSMLQNSQEPVSGVAGVFVTVGPQLR